MTRSSPTEARRTRSRVRVIIVAIVLVVGACSSAPPPTSTSIGQAPDLGVLDQLDLRIRAFERACDSVRCLGRPIYAEDALSAVARGQLLEAYPDIVFVTDGELIDLYADGYTLPGGGTFIAIGRVHDTERADVIGVDVWIEERFQDGKGQTVLFVWQGERWEDTTSDSVDVTVTTAVP